MTKIGRNEACPCGSGKKFKVCCVNLSQDQLNNLAKIPDDWKTLFRNIERGYAAANKNYATDAIHAWDLAWVSIGEKLQGQPKTKSLREFDEQIQPETSLEVFVQDWAELMSAMLQAVDAPIDHIKTHAQYYLDRLTASSELIKQNVMSLLAEAHAKSGDIKAALKLYQAIEKQFNAELEEEELAALKARIDQLKALKPTKTSTTAVSAQS